jgi:hypothetical protein
MKDLIRPVLNRSWLHNLVMIGLCILFLIGCTWRLAGSYAPHQHPDEVIPVVLGSHLDHTLNTDWKQYPELQSFFGNSSQFNFSAYIISANLLLNLASAPNTSLDKANRLAGLRAISAILGLCLAFLSGALALRLGAERLAAAATAVLVILSPQLFMDSIYARPETFVACLSLLFVLTGLSPNQFTNSVLSGVIVGILSATKFYFLLVAPFLFWARWRDGLPAYGRISIGFAIGLIIGMPQAVVYPLHYLDGVQFLMNFYSAGWYPYSYLSDASLITRLSYRIIWTAQTTGAAAVLFSVVGLITIALRRDKTALILLSPFFLLFVYFWCASAFVERNVSQSLAVLYAVAGVGISTVILGAKRWTGLGIPIATAVVIALCAFVPYRVSANIFAQLVEGNAGDETRVRALEQAIEQNFKTKPVLIEWEQAPNACAPGAIAEIYIAGSKGPARWDPVVWTELVRVKSRFEEVLPSTLQTYISRTTVFLRCAEPGNPPSESPRG